MTKALNNTVNQNKQEGLPCTGLYKYLSKDLYNPCQELISTSWIKAILCKSVYYLFIVCKLGQIDAKAMYTFHRIIFLMEQFIELASGEKELAFPKEELTALPFPSLKDVLFFSCDFRVQNILKLFFPNRKTVKVF